MDNFLLIQLVALVFAVSFGLTASIWGTRHWQMSAIRRRGDQRAVQSSHSAPTPRLGGGAIVPPSCWGRFLYLARLAMLRRCYYCASCPS